MFYIGTEFLLTFNILSAILKIIIESLFALINIGVFMKKSFKLLGLIGLTITFAAIGAVFGYYVIFDKDYVFLPPMFIGIIGTVCFVYFFVKEAFIGYNEYSFSEDELLIVRKGKSIDAVKKENIKDLKLVYDCVDEDLHFISFKYNSKKYYITVDDSNKKCVSEFIEDLTFEKSKNILYYVIRIFAC